MRYKETQQFTPNFEKFEHMVARHKSDMQLSKNIEMLVQYPLPSTLNGCEIQSHTHSQQIHTLKMSKAFGSQKNKINPVYVIRI